MQSREKASPDGGQKVLIRKFNSGVDGVLTGDDSGLVGQNDSSEALLVLVSFGDSVGVH